MPAILKADYKKYIPKEELRIQRKYKGGHIGKALYLPKGEGLADLFNFFNSNKDSISNIGNVISGVAGVASNIGKLTTDTIKGIDEIKALRQRNAQLAQPQQIISEQAIKNIIDNEDGVKPSYRVPKNHGEGFYFSK